MGDRGGKREEGEGGRGRKEWEEGVGEETHVHPKQVRVCTVTVCLMVRKIVMKLSC